jgi:hypothetical protein
MNMTGCGRQRCLRASRASIDAKTRGSADGRLPSFDCIGPLDPEGVSALAGVGHLTQAAARSQS